MIALDFETCAIEDWRAPKPVGFAAATTLRDGRYFAFGHPSHNNIDEAKARWEFLERAEEHDEVWFFNAGFDVNVANAWLRRVTSARIPWSKVHCAQILAFLGDPMATRRDMKGFVEDHLGIPAKERSALHKWIKENVPAAKKLRKDSKKLGAFISDAPGDLVGKYAKVDVYDVLRLVKLYRRHIGTRPYERERALLPVLAEMTERGIPIARKRLARDAEAWRGWHATAERWLLARLGLRELKPALVVAAIEKLGLASGLEETPQSTPEAPRYSLASESLQFGLREGTFFDAEFVAVWTYHSYLGWLLRTFVEPWLSTGEDFVHPQWNGVLQERGGAVTGRLSSSPNVQNISNAEKLAKVNAWMARMPRALARQLGPIPNLRLYIEAPRGMRLVGCDISQQELRILGHFVPSIGDWYRADPKTDVHNKVRDIIRDVAQADLPRSIIKVINFCTIYGGGAKAISEQGEIPYDEARKFKQIHGEALPGIGKWDWELNRSGKFSTVGGREYEVVNGKEYRSKNYAIQGSAGDQLKELMPWFHGLARNAGGWMVLTAHDEALTCVPAKHEREVRREMEELVESTGLGGKRAMFDVPMLAESYAGRRWEKS